MKDLFNKLEHFQSNVNSQFSSLKSQLNKLSTPIKLIIPVILLLSTVLIASIIDQRQDQRGRAAQCDNPGESSEHNPNCITPTETPTDTPIPTTEQPTSIPTTDVTPTSLVTPISTSTPTDTPIPTLTSQTSPTSLIPTVTPTQTPTPTPTFVPVGGSNTTITYVVVTSSPTSAVTAPTGTTNQTIVTTRGQTNIIIKITQTPTPAPDNPTSPGQIGQNIQISPIYTVQIPAISKSPNLITYFLSWLESLLKFFGGFTGH